MIHRKIYISRASSDVSTATLDALLVTSRRNNQRDGLTGLLISDQGMFFQILEGPEAPLNQCYARIVQDPRHSDIRLMSDTRPAERAFPDWKMGYARPKDLPAQAGAAVCALVEMAEEDAAVHAPQNVQDLIDAFLNVFEASDAALAQHAG